MTEATNLVAAGGTIFPETGGAQERPDVRGPGNNYLILASGYGNTITIEDEEPQESSAFVPDADGSEATVIVPEVQALRTINLIPAPCLAHACRLGRRAVTASF